jgi:hypothetical protein
MAMANKDKATMVATAAMDAIEETTITVADAMVATIDGGVHVAKSVAIGGMGRWNVAVASIPSVALTILVLATQTR